MGKPRAALTICKFGAAVVQVIHLSLSLIENSFVMKAALPGGFFIGKFGRTFAVAESRYLLGYNEKTDRSCRSHFCFISLTHFCF
jgi:hypothetical protein